MLEETLKSVRDAEAKAEEILKEADAKAASVLEDAKVKAQAMKEDTASKVRSLSQKTTQAVHKEGDTQLEMAAKEARKEIEALRELVVPKKPEALEAIGSIADAADQYLCDEEEQESDPGTSAGTGRHGD